MTHTPGQWNWYWRIEDDMTDCGVFWERSKGQAVSICRAPRYETKDQWEANARLIAAAPELLDALESIIAIWESGMPFKDNEIGHARAAIAKATGEAK